MNSFFTSGFLKTASPDENVSPVKAGLSAGGGVAGGALAANTVKNVIAPRTKGSDVLKTRSTKKFTSKMKPGDVILSGGQKGSPLDKNIKLKDYFETFSKSKKEWVKNLGKKRLPFSEHDLLTAVSGSPYYHMGVYLGKGRMINADGSVVKIEGVYHGLQDNIAKAYRPEGVSKKEIQKAISRAKSLKGRPYPGIPEQIRKGLRMVFDPTKGGKACTKGPKGNVICTQVASTAYPKQLKKNLISSGDVMYNKNMKLISQLSARKIPLKRQIISKGVAPVLHGLKWALPAAALAGAGAGVFNQVMRKKKRLPSSSKKEQ